MKRHILVMGLIAALPIAQAAAQGVTSPTAAPPLDGFTAQYGFPTFPVAPEYDVPYIWNGPDYNTLRIGDLTKIPIINQAATGASSSTGTSGSSGSRSPGSLGSSVPGLLSHP